MARGLTRGKASVRSFGTLRRVLVIVWMPALGLVVVGLLASTLVEPVSGSPYEDNDAALSTLRAVAEKGGYTVRTSVASPAVVDDLDPRRTLLVIVDPARAYTDGEADWLAGWLAKGGRAIVADGGGRAAPLLAPHDLAPTPFRIFDAQVGGGDPTTVQAHWSDPSTTHTVLMRTPLAMVGGGASRDTVFTPLAHTGNASFIDLDGNGRLDEGDTRGPFVVAAQSTQARLVVVTSGTMFKESLAPRASNSDVIAGLLADLLPDGGDVVIDVSHAQRQPGIDQVFNAAARAAGLTTHGWGSLILPPVAILLVFAFMRPHLRGFSSWEVRDMDPHEVTVGDPADVAPNRMLARIQHSQDARQRRGEPPEALRDLVRRLHAIGREDAGEWNS